MRRRVSALLAALALACALWSAPARASSSPSLAWEDGEGRGEVLLALQGLDGSGIYAAQLELTLSGSWPDADFSPAGQGVYSVCQAEEDGRGTHLTVCLSSRTAPLGSGERLFLGTLDLGGRGSGDDVLPPAVQLTLLGRGLNRIEELSGAADVQGRADISDWGGGTDSGSDEQTYRITVLQSQGGTVKADASRAEEGERVTLTVTEEAGWELESLSVYGAKDREVAVSERDGGKYTFRMPGSGVEVAPVFARTGREEPDEPEPPSVLPFTDVRESDWYCDSVRYVYGQGLMNGVTADRFGPDEPATRGMIVTILHRMEGSPEAPAPAFPDVRADFYYAQPITWAASRGIVTGYEDGTFGPEDNITREQLAAILYRYARYKGWDTAASAALDRFPDVGKISPYALEPFAWAVGEGLIAGMANGQLSPGGTATRAEVATILMRLEALVQHS